MSTRVCGGHLAGDGAALVTAGGLVLALPGRGADMSADPTTGLAAPAGEVLSTADVAARLMAAHQPDDERRCLGCVGGPFPDSRPPWPCPLYTLAERAALQGHDSEPREGEQ